MKIIVLFLCCLIPATEIWKLEKTIGTVKAYTADIGKPYKKIKVVCPMNAPFNKVFDEYFKVEQQHTWMSEIPASQLLKKESDNVWYTRYEVKFPFPMKNRELIYKMTKTTTDNEILVNYTAVPNYLPENKDFIRMTISSGYWKFTKVTATTSTCETVAYNETAGVPAWIVNMFIVDIPSNTMNNFKKRIEGSK